MSITASAVRVALTTPSVLALTAIAAAFVAALCVASAGGDMTPLLEAGRSRP